MYSYINNNELLILHGKGRKALIRPNITTRDLDEYINTLAICLNNSGINVSMFNMPKIFKNKAKNTYSLPMSLFKLVRVTGLEPVRHATHAPQTCLSANSSTLANLFF